MVPRLWNETIESHRREVREAITNTAAMLVIEHGLRGVTMSQIAKRAGIGRATLYKYFPDVDVILREWHASQVDSHLKHLAEIRDAAGDPEDRLVAVLTAYAHIVQRTRSHDSELVKFLHPDQQIADAQRQLHDMIKQLIIEGVRQGQLRNDVHPGELANYCLHALTGAATLKGDVAIARLVNVILDGLRAAR